MFFLQANIKRRHFEDWKMELAIVQNPHTQNPRDLWDMLSAETDKPDDAPLDKAGMENLKRMLAGGSAVKVK